MNQKKIKLLLKKASLNFEDKDYPAHLARKVPKKEICNFNNHGLIFKAKGR